MNPIALGETPPTALGLSLRRLRTRHPGRDQLALQLRVHERHLLFGKGEEVLRQGLGAADPRVGVPEVVEERVRAAPQPVLNKERHRAKGLEAGRPQLRVVDLTCQESKEELGSSK